MVSSRRQSAPSVSLFPFLAVMVCAMGALIFLLIVTTRRIREQSVARAQAEARVAEPEAKPVILVPAVPRVEPIPTEPVHAPVPWPPESEQPWLPLPDAVAELTPPTDRAAEAAALAEAVRSEWEAIIAALSAELASMRDAAAEFANAADQEEAELAAAEDRLAELEKQQQELIAERAAITQVDRLAEQNIEELTGQIEAVEEELAQAQDTRAAAESKFRILPYDGRLGTVRRPIIIECTETGLTFASEEITLTPEQLNGFPPIRNPLQAGAEALINYWAAKDFQDRLSGESTGQPYVLLVVRPRGTVAYYVARRLLESMKSPFGYELVEQDQEFEWPETTPSAIELCRTAVDAVLRDRDRLLARTSSGRLPIARQLQFDDGSGRFYLEEVERLRTGGKTVNFGGRKWDRNATRPTGPSVSEPVPRRRVIEYPEHAQQTSRPVTQNADQTPNRLPRDYGAPADLYDSQVRPRNDNLDRVPRQADWESAGRSIHREADSVNMGRPRADSPTRGSASSATPQPSHQIASGGSDSVGLNPQSPPFSRRSRSGKIGFERDVLIRVNDSAVIVENEDPIQITSGMSRERLQHALAITLDRHVRSWGEPPQGFDWIPTAELQVLPGGNQYQDRLMDVISGWGLDSRIEHVLE